VFGAVTAFGAVSAFGAVLDQNYFWARNVFPWLVGRQFDDWQAIPPLCAALAAAGRLPRAVTASIMTSSSFFLAALAVPGDFQKEIVFQ